MDIESASQSKMSVNFDIGGSRDEYFSAHISSTLLYLARYVHISRTTLMSGYLVMNTSKPTLLLFFSILLAIYLYNALIECSCYVKISVHLL